MAVTRREKSATTATTARALGGGRGGTAATARQRHSAVATSVLPSDTVASVLPARTA